MVKLSFPTIKLTATLAIICSYMQFMHTENHDTVKIVFFFIFSFFAQKKYKKADIISN